MSSPAGFLLSTGVLLLLSLCRVSDANFSNAEFADTVGTCFSDAVRQQFAVSLPTDQVKLNVAHFDFEKNNELAAEHGAHLGSHETVGLCFKMYMKNYTHEAAILAATSSCACESLKEERGFPTLRCDEIVDALIFGPEDGPLVDNLFAEGGLDPQNGTDVADLSVKMLECAVKTSSLDPSNE